MSFILILALIGSACALTLAPFRQSGTYTTLPDVGNHKIMQIEMVHAFQMYFYTKSLEIVCDLQLIATGSELSIKVGLNGSYDNTAVAVGNETRKQFEIYWDPSKIDINYHSKNIYNRIDPKNTTLSSIQHVAFEPQYETSITFDDTYMYIADKYDMFKRIVDNVPLYDNLVPYLQCNLSMVDELFVNKSADIDLVTLLNLDLRKLGFKEELYRFKIELNTTAKEHDFPNNHYTYFKIIKNNSTQLKGTGHYFTNANITLGINFDEGIIHVNNDNHLTVLWHEQATDYRFTNMKQIILHVVKNPFFSHTCELLCLNKIPLETKQYDHWYQRWLQHSKTLLYDNTPFIFKSKYALDTYCQDKVPPRVKIEYVGTYGMAI